MGAVHNSPLFFFVYMSVLLACCVLYEVSGFLAGGYSSLSIDDDALAAAKFAVAEHNKKGKTSLEFVSIVDGLQQISAGTNYKMVILAKDDQTRNYYEAYVFDDWKNYRTLYFFNRIRFVPDCPDAPPPPFFIGAYELIESQDPMVVATAKFAVVESNEQAKTSLEFVRVVEGKAQVDHDINYKLLILAKDSSTYNYYEAVINVDRDFFHHVEGKFITLHSFNRIRSGPEDTNAPTPQAFDCCT